MPVGLHLDHADTHEELRAAIDAGFTSLMIDGSTLPFELHVQLAVEARGMLAWEGLPLEAELGHVSGAEEGVTLAEAAWTDPDDAARFVAATRVDWLAVAVGNVHGGSPAEGGLQRERLRAIAEAVDRPAGAAWRVGPGRRRSPLRGGTARRQDQRRHVAA